MAVQYLLILFPVADWRGVAVGLLGFIMGLAALLAIVGPRLAAVTRTATQGVTRSSGTTKDVEGRPWGGTYSRIWRHAIAAVAVQVGAVLISVLLAGSAQLRAGWFAIIVGVTSILAAFIIAAARRSIAQVELARGHHLQVLGETLQRRGKAVLAATVVGLVVAGTSWIMAVDAVLLSHGLLGNASYFVMALGFLACMAMLVVGDRRLGESQSEVKQGDMPLPIRSVEVATTPTVLGNLAVLGAFQSRGPGLDVDLEWVSTFTSYTALVAMSVILMVGAYLPYAKTQREVLRTLEPSSESNGD
ncbi:MAG: hypothetical protein ACRDTQ_12875 [Micromonosporaceae bacterium]